MHHFRPLSIFTLLIILALPAFAGPRPLVDIYFRVIDEEVTKINFSYEPVNDFSQIPKSPRAWLKKKLKLYVRRGLKDDLGLWISTQGFSVPLDPRTEDARKIVVEMKNNGLAEDIRKSSYQTNEICRDENEVEKEGVATGVRGDSICFSVEKLLNNWYDSNPKITWSELQERLMALAVHEHSHHFGYEDRDHAIYAFAQERAAAFVEGYDRVASVSVSAEFADARAHFLLARSSLMENKTPRLRCVLSPLTAFLHLPSEFEIEPDIVLSNKLSILFRIHGVFPVYRSRNDEWQGTWGGGDSGAGLNRLTLRTGSDSIFFEIASAQGERLPAISSGADAPYAIAYGECSPTSAQHP